MNNSLGRLSFLWSCLILIEALVCLLMLFQGTSLSLRLGGSVHGCLQRSALNGLALGSSEEVFVGSESLSADCLVRVQREATGELQR